jgi:hypothetical protein
MVSLVSIQVLHDLLMRSHTYLMYEHEAIEIGSDQGKAPAGFENPGYLAQQPLSILCLHVFYDIGAQHLGKRSGCKWQASSVRKYMQLRLLGDVQIYKTGIVCFTTAEIQAKRICIRQARTIPTGCDWRYARSSTPAFGQARHPEPQQHPLD